MSKLTQIEIQDTIKACVNEQITIAEAKWDWDASFVDDYGFDSLDLVELTMCLEEEFGMEFPDSEIEGLYTAAQCVQKLCEKEGIEYVRHA